MRILCLPPWSVASHEFPSNSTYSHTFFFFSSFPTLLQSDPQDLLFKLYFKQGPIFWKLLFLFYRNLLILSFGFSLVFQKTLQFPKEIDHWILAPNTSMLQIYKFLLTKRPWAFLCVIEILTCVLSLLILEGFFRCRNNADLLCTCKNT